jgi:hypothetical protein
MPSEATFPHSGLVTSLTFPDEDPTDPNGNSVGRTDNPWIFLPVLAGGVSNGGLLCVNGRGVHFNTR